MPGKQISPTDFDKYSFRLRWMDTPFGLFSAFTLRAWNAGIPMSTEIQPFPLYESLKIDLIALADSFLGYNFRPKLDEWHPEKKRVWKNGRQKKPDGTCMFNFQILSTFGGVSCSLKKSNEDGFS